MTGEPIPDASGQPARNAGGALRQAVAAGLALVVLGGAGWNIWHQLAHPPDPYAVDLTKPFRFHDDAGSNVPLDDASLEGLEFRTLRGEPVTLGGFRGRKHVVLVVTRGRTEKAVPGPYAGRICLYCASQTSRLIANYPELARRDAEVVVVFPVGRQEDAGSVAEFNAAVRADALKFDRRDIDGTPFPVVLDVGLRAVNQLGLRADLAKPSTYILDKQGRVRFAHVGQSLADRPSVKAILRQLDQLAAGAASAP